MKNAAVLLLLSGCGTIEIGSYGDAVSGTADGGASGASSASPGAGSSGSGSGGAGVGGSVRLGGGRSGEGGDGAGGGGEGGSNGELDSVDIGDTGAVGSAVVEGGSWTLEGSGADIEDTADGFRFLYAKLSGDGQIVARIQDITPTHPWTKVGVMIRDDLTASAKNAFMVLRSSLGSAFQYRPATGEATQSTWQEEPLDFSREHTVRYLSPPKWLKLTREGNRFSAFSSDDGECWWPRWTQDELAFDDSEAFFGVALSAGGYGDLASAVVTDVQVESSIEPHNARCERAAVDGDLPVPAEGQWIVPPGRFGGDAWDYTTTNPNGLLPSVKCDPNAQDVVPYEIAPRRDGPDHPNCPNRNFSPTWTQLGFDPENGWQLGALGIGTYEARPGDKRSTYVDSQGVWLRKEFSLSSEQQKNELMLWGRWDDGITVYVNGVLATWSASGTSEYKYLGLSDAARGALKVGESNVIAVRVEWDTYVWQFGEVVSGWANRRFFDLGLTTEGRLANLPLDRAAEPNSGVSAYVDTLKELLQRQGISGATFAISKSGAIVASAGFGWRDKNLTVPMPRDAALRLTLSDVITESAIVKLIEDGAISSSTPVFPLLGLEPVPNRSPGANVDLITVEQLRSHTSGIGAIPQDQGMLDEMAFAFGITPDKWKPEHAARWLYSLDATDVGGAQRYSPDAFFLLRYLIDKLVAPRTLEDYLRDDMGMSGVAISHERLFGREPNQGYITRQPVWDRWLSLESYLSLSAPAPTFATFVNDFRLGYTLESENSYTPGGGGALIGIVPGTYSIAYNDPTRALSITLISNNHDALDELIPLWDHLTYDGSPCLFGPEDPRNHLDRYQFIDNDGQPGHYLNIEANIAATPALAGWWSAQWLFEPVGDSYYTIKNRWTDQYLHMDQGLLQVSPIDPTSPSAHWQLIYVGGVFELQNRASNEYLSLENGTLVTSTTTTATGSLWRFCN